MSAGRWPQWKKQSVRLNHWRATHVQCHMHCQQFQDNIIGAQKKAPIHEKPELEEHRIKESSYAAKQAQRRHDFELEHADEKKTKKDRMDTIIGSIAKAARKNSEPRTVAPVSVLAVPTSRELPQGFLDEGLAGCGRPPIVRTK